MKITDEMVMIVAKGYFGCHHKHCDYRSLGEALEAALADVPEPVPCPFVLNAAEAAELKDTLAGVGGSIHLGRALDRAVRTLGAPAVEPLSEEVRDAVELMRSTLRDYDSAAAKNVIVAFFDERFPKPAPVQRTPEELEKLITDEASSWSREQEEAMAELVRRAK